MPRHRLGFHVSISGGISNSVDNATKIGCSTFQIFTRNPRGWIAKALDPADVDLFRRKLGASGINQESVIVHMPYLPNLSGPPGGFYDKSETTLVEEVQRCQSLGIQYLVIHLGSHMGKGPESGIKQLTKALGKAISSAEKTKNRSKVMILLENNARQKNGIGGNFEELRTILDKTIDGKIGICLDTCHLFVAGHDIRGSDAVESTLEKFDSIVGLEYLKVIHLNDSKGELRSNLDRHQHIGLGNIGLEGMTAFLNNRKTKNLPFIMETPIDDTRGDTENLKVVRGLISQE